MTTVHLVHGFNVQDNGRRSTDRLAPYFNSQGFETRQHDYGWKFLLGVRFANPRVAREIAATVQPGDIGCGHSNGCLILALAADLGAPFAGLVFINPALEPAREIAPQVKWAHVYHNRGDAPVEAAQLLDFLPWNWGRRHPWGEMGNVGYTGADARVRNFDCGRQQPPLSGHSAMFAPANLATWGRRVASLARIETPLLAG